MGSIWTLAVVGAVVGGFIGNHIANKVNAVNQDRWKYIAGGAVAGAAVGATVGYLAGPAIASATGVSGISTYFKPTEGLNYWLKQISDYAPK